MTLSIIIVNYKVEQNLLACLESIKKHITQINYEVIVVENDPNTNLSKKLQGFFKLKYIKAKKNNGFGSGNNLGAKSAKGEYLFFLNPDTKIQNGSIISLLKLFEDENVGVVAPLLLDVKKNPYKKQGTLRLTPITAIFSLSFIYKLFPNNFIAKRFWLKKWDKASTYEVDVAPGTAFIITRSLFFKLKGFDEKFFLFFEENDLCNRVKKLRLRIYISPLLKVIHEWGRSTIQRPDTKEIFAESRKYYFIKYYGMLGFFTNLILSDKFINFVKSFIPLVLIIFIALFLRFYKISENFVFYGEVGDNLLSVKNAYFENSIPLLGPPTSHPWLSFGPFFYYIYAPVLIAFKFSPLSHAYLAGVAGVSIVIINYFFVRHYFSLKSALISSYFIAISPIFLFFTRSGRFFTYTPIFLYLFLYSLFEVCIFKKKRNRYFFLLGLSLGIMLNLHYASLTLFPFIAVAFIISRLLPRMIQILVFTLGIVLSFLPTIIYNFQNGFSMLENLFVWAGYKFVQLFGLFNSNSEAHIEADQVTPFYFIAQNLIYDSNQIFQVVVTLIFVCLGVYAGVKLLKKERLEYVFLGILLVIGVVIVLLHGSKPSHYYIAILPLPIIIFSIFLDKISIKKLGKLIVFIILLVITCSNIFYFKNGWFNSYHLNTSVFYNQQVQLTRLIVKDSNGEKFALKRLGHNDNFDHDFAQNYIYLLWMQGNEPVKNAKIIYTIYDQSESFPSILGKNKVIYRSDNVLVTR